MASLVLTIKTSKDPTVFKQASQDRENLNRLINLLSGVNIGAIQATVDVQSASDDPVAAYATATITYASIANLDTITLFGETLTCVTGTPSTDEFKKLTDATVTAANLVTAANANEVISSLCTASSAAGVVTFTLKTKGIVGNYLADITKSSSGIALVQWANGTGGAQNSAVSIAR